MQLVSIIGCGYTGRRLAERLVPAIVPNEATPGNRIHVTDLVTPCVAAGFNAAADRRIYNVTDGSDDSHTEYLQRVATIARLPSPPLISRAEQSELFPRRHGRFSPSRAASTTVECSQNSAWR